MPAMSGFRVTGSCADDFASGLAHHVFLIAIRGEPRSAVLHRGNPLQPLQVILTGPGDVPPMAGLDAAIGPLPALPSPQHLARTAYAAGALVPREVTGEILRDASGRLFERIGDRVRPVNRLYTGARGEMIDMTPARDVSAGRGADASSRHDGRAPAGPQVDAADAEPLDATLDVDDAQDSPDAMNGPRSFRDLAHRLTPEPGLWRLVRYADFIDAITPQLADPRRLQPGHQLACYAQVYELAVTLPIGALEEAATNELGNAGRLLPLSYDLCRRLALSLPRPALALAAARQASRLAHAPGIVPAGARFLTLRLAMDPTAETVVEVARAEAPAAAAPAAPAAAPIAAPAPTESRPGASAAGIGQRCAVPEEYAKPWDMRLSRDEAIYDMTLATSRGALQRIFHRWKDSVTGSDLKKWHALLSGRTCDEQLWAVKPPRGAFGDARIRQWVEQTLQLGGYDVARMRVEWEIHWRRKGL